MASYKNIPGGAPLFRTLVLKARRRKLSRFAPIAAHICSNRNRLSVVVVVVVVVAAVMVVWSRGRVSCGRLTAASDAKRHGDGLTTHMWRVCRATARKDSGREGTAALLVF